VPGTELGIERNRVVAVVATLSDGQPQVGSGYLVRGRYVLTARHCTRDRFTSAVAPLRVIRADNGASGDVVDIVSSPRLDVALLELADETPWADDIPRPVYARIDRSHSGTLVNCEGIGYPLMQRDPLKGARDTAEFHGTIYQTDGAESGRLLIREPLIHPGQVAVPGAEATVAEKNGASPWGGLSGAMVFYQGRAIGIVVEHHPRQGDSALQAIGFDVLARAAFEEKAARRIATVLHLPAEEAMPWAMSAPAHTGDMAPSSRPSDVLPPPAAVDPGVTPRGARIPAATSIAAATSPAASTPATSTPAVSAPAARPPAQAEERSGLLDHSWETLNLPRQTQTPPRQPSTPPAPQPTTGTGCMFGGANAALSGASLQAGKALNEGADALQRQIMETELAAAAVEGEYQELQIESDANNAAANSVAQAAQHKMQTKSKIFKGFDQVIEG
jgi:hypothetical protein